MTHSARLFLACGALSAAVSVALGAAGGLMIVGTLLFSGNLYLRSLADFHGLHVVTPWGGMCFILGWIALAVGALTSWTRRDGRPARRKSPA